MKRPPTMIHRALSCLPVYDQTRRGPFVTLRRVGYVQTSVGRLRVIPDDLKRTQQEAARVLVNLPCETASMLVLDQDRRPLGLVRIATGDRMHVHVSVDAIITRFSLLAGAHGIVIWHNHLHSNARPSDMDIAAFNRLRDELPDYIDFVDFCIATSADHYSFRAMGHFGTFATAVNC